MLVVKIELHPGGLRPGEATELIEEVVICNVKALEGDNRVYEIYRHAEKGGIDREPDGVISHHRSHGAAALVDRALYLTRDC